MALFKPFIIVALCFTQVNCLPFFIGPGIGSGIWDLLKKNDSQSDIVRTSPQPQPCCLPGIFGLGSGIWFGALKTILLDKNADIVRSSTMSPQPIAALENKLFENKTLNDRLKRSPQPEPFFPVIAPLIIPLIIGIKALEDKLSQKENEREQQERQERQEIMSKIPDVISQQEKFFRQD